MIFEIFKKNELIVILKMINLLKMISELFRINKIINIKTKP